MDMEGKFIILHYLALLIRKWMKEEGMAGNVEFDMSDLPNKEFITYRKTKSHNETIFFRYHFFNFITKHYSRKTNSVYD